MSVEELKSALQNAVFVYKAVKKMAEDSNDLGNPFLTLATNDVRAAFDALSKIPNPEQRSEIDRLKRQRTLEESEETMKDLLSKNYFTAKGVLRHLEKDAENGDKDAGMALVHFYQSVNDPNYKITWPPSVKLLTEKCLIDESNRVHKTTRKAFLEKK
jgi:hypothetical protein